MLRIQATAAHFASSNHYFEFQWLLLEYQHRTLQCVCVRARASSSSQNWPREGAQAHTPPSLLCLERQGGSDRKTLTVNLHHKKQKAVDDYRLRLFQFFKLFLSLDIIPSSPTVSGHLTTTDMAVDDDALIFIKRSDGRDGHHGKRSNTSKGTAKGMLRLVLSALLLAMAAFPHVVQMQEGLLCSSGNSLGLSPQHQEITAGTSSSRNKSKVFIAIKSSLARDSVYRERLSQIAQTWLSDAVENERIDIKFFVDQPRYRFFPHSFPSILLDDEDEDDDQEENEEKVIDVSPHLIITPRLERYGRGAIKQSSVFSYFLQHYSTTEENDDGDGGGTNAVSNPIRSWFCSFDDDNYVLIDNLLEVLDSFANNDGHKNSNNEVYVGRPSRPWRHWRTNETFHL